MFTTFRGGQSGTWRVTLNSPSGATGLAAVPALAITQSAFDRAADPAVHQRLAAGRRRLHLRYVEKAEKEQLAEKQAPLGRKEASFAALIPIRKSAAWWELNQDERREIWRRSRTTSPAA